MKKKLPVFLSVIFTLVLALLFIPTTIETPVFAESSGDYTYTVSNGEATITDVSTSISGDITIPFALGGYPVTSIGNYAFESCDNLTSVTIPNSVTSIGYRVFYNCSALTSVTIPDSVTSIGNFAFEGCSSLTSVYISDLKAWCEIEFDGITSNPLFYADTLYLNGEKVTDLDIPEGTTKISNFAFYDCYSLTSVTIPDNVTSIGKGAFDGCSKLKYNTYDEGKYLGNAKNPYLALIKPSSVFVETITIQENSKIIADDAFEYCSSLISVTIGNSVTSIDNYAFSYCSSLTSVTIGNSVTSIGSSAFEGCSSLTSVTIPDSVTSIGSYAFEGCSSLTSVTIPDNVTSIGKGAFNGCSKLKYNTYDEGKYLGNATNPYLALMDTTSSSIEAIAIHENTKIIGANAFYNCSSLTSVTIGNSVTSIGNGAFNGCTALKTIYYYGTLEELKEIEISYGNTELTGATWHHNFCGNNKHSFSSECDTLCNICFVSRTVWGAHSFADNEQFCQHCDAPRYLSIAFSNYHDKAYIADCDEKASGEIIIPHSYEGVPLTSIGDDAFEYCKSLTSVTIPDSVTFVAGWAFLGCSSLTSITIPDSVTVIGSHTFSDCTGLTSVTIGNSVTSIGDFAFWSCISLASIAIPDSVTSIGWGAFSGCRNLTSITIPNRVTAIDSSAFSGCTALKEIVLPKSVATIKSNAFNGCVITDIWYTGSVEDRNLIVCESGNDSLLSATWHYIDNACDSSCSACDATRTTKHVYDSSEDLICNECGYERPPYVPGDLDGVEGITLDDAIHLLYYVNFPEKYPVNQPVDFDSSGKEDLDDAIYLLYHVNFPGNYPLK